MRSSKKDVSLEKIEISMRPPTIYDVNNTANTATKVPEYAMARLILIKRMVLKIDQLKLPDPHDSPTFNKNSSLWAYEGSPGETVPFTEYTGVLI